MPPGTVSTFFHASGTLRRGFFVKRLTQTDKWRDPWFRKLPGEAKLLWYYLCENCDQAGVIELDLELASLDTRQTIKAEHVAAIGDRLQVLPNGKLWIKGFITFQYGKLSRDCRPHWPVFAALEHHGLSPDTFITVDHDSKIIADEKKVNPNNTLPVGFEYPTRQDKTSTGSVQGGVGGNGQPTATPVMNPIGEPTFPVNGLADVEFFQSQVNKLFKRERGFRWSYEEESYMAEVLKRGTWKTELDLIRFKWKEIEEKYRKRTVAGLLQTWTNQIDRLRTQPEKRCF